MLSIVMAHPTGWRMRATTITNTVTVTAAIVMSTSARRQGQLAVDGQPVPELGKCSMASDPGFAGHVRRLSRGELPPRLRMRPSTITVSSKIKRARFRVRSEFMNTRVRARECSLAFMGDRRLRPLRLLQLI